MLQNGAKVAQKCVRTAQKARHHAPSWPRPEPLGAPPSPMSVAAAVDGEDLRRLADRSPEGASPRKVNLPDTGNKYKVTAAESYAEGRSVFLGAPEPAAGGWGGPTIGARPPRRTLGRAGASPRATGRYHCCCRQRSGTGPQDGRSTDAAGTAPSHLQFPRSGRKQAPSPRRWSFVAPLKEAAVAAHFLSANSASHDRARAYGTCAPCRDLRGGGPKPLAISAEGAFGGKSRCGSLHRDPAGWWLAARS
jgi:hypothetical protein